MEEISIIAQNSFHQEWTFITYPLNAVHLKIPRQNNLGGLEDLYLKSNIFHRNVLSGPTRRSPLLPKNSLVKVQFDTNTFKPTPLVGHKH
jgi:hypothetical protein